MLPKVSIIVLYFNEPKLTIDCLASLQAINYPRYEIIVVDNGSALDIAKSVKKQFPRVTVLRNEKNEGYAEGNNIGYKKATGEYILLLNNDAIVEKNFLNPLVNALEKDKHIAGVQPKILQYPHKEMIDSVGSYFMYSGFLYHFGHNKEDQEKYNHASEIFSMKGACMLLRKSVVDKIGLFDKDYFAYFEETDLCQRIWLSGWTIQYIPISKIYHIGGQTSKKLLSTFVQYNSYKNRIYTYCKNLEMITLLKVLPLHFFLCEVVSFMYIVTGKFALAATMQRALWWNFVNIPRIIRERKRIQKLRKVSDVSYLNKITKTTRLSYYYHLFATSLAGYND